MDQNQSSSSRADRKTIEKNRRTQMKGLYTELNSLVPRQNSREAKSLTDQLDEAEKYIRKLQMKVEKMKEKRERLMENNPNARFYGGLATPPQIEIHESEGLDIVNASFSVTENSVFHTIHSKVGEFAQEGAIDRVTEKLNTFVAGST
ncbi:putative achaete-scute transcription factor-related protein [Heracleum sosnowskyi]|uniref:Achaete-scute transcription factor-related protein n=1 Tax=Heracleum sosnowskyi TaxID=360622 RepID=A0AAD8HE23_9APIA|nr:putative achaete-scute transcription factor-related protein [Heracleum sosnowskyi]